MASDSDGSISSAFILLFILIEIWQLPSEHAQNPHKNKHQESYKQPTLLLFLQQIDQRTRSKCRQTSKPNKLARDDVKVKQKRYEKLWSHSSWHIYQKWCSSVAGYVVGKDQATPTCQVEKKQKERTQKDHHYQQLILFDEFTLFDIFKRKISYHLLGEFD